MSWNEMVAANWNVIVSKTTPTVTISLKSIKNQKDKQTQIAN